MKFLFFVLLLFVTSVVGAQPFLIADVPAGTTSCGVFLDAIPKVTIAVTGLICKYDLAGIAVGAHSAKVTAIALNDPVWGTQESTQSAPLAFTKPAVPGAPSGLRLSAS